ncbi:inactive transglutaminase family protein [Oceanospirillum sediminis]|uniref:Inactive transglutaminase family protein n=1 Tax=Oceanospirillum sediminis TaxID=2760088 RepID=A0A839IK25_9GAMM|nr:inactive transglutaminase family protein [Oceanospirillum sediminis]MBB1485080.1 inactive transglutaminase family protein [Oceanospirillum sediminis]
MSRRVPFYLLTLILLAAGIALSIYRHDVYSVPWTPGETREQWVVEARIKFIAKGDPVSVVMQAPDTQPGFTLIDESAASQGYGFTRIEQQGQRLAQWSVREAQDHQLIYYKARFLVDPGAQVPVTPPLQAVTPHIFEHQRQTAAVALLEEASRRSADTVTLVRALVTQFNDEGNQNAALLLNSLNREDALVSLLSMKGIAARVVPALKLKDGRRRQPVLPMVEIWQEQERQWLLFDPVSGRAGPDERLLIWGQSYQSLLDVVGGRDSDISFSMLAQDIPARQATWEKVQAEDLLNFSIHSLPVEEQAMFKTIMLIPVGALIVVFLRILVGIKTSGTFMPVLIAVAFVQTQLVTGIVGFILIVSTGLLIRSYLSHLNLLLVARISAVIITVILMISVMAVIAFRVGLVEGLSITFFPMIILSWTIERMSVLWEEDGAKEVLVQGGGSLVTAVLVYGAMTDELVRHLTFNFVGLQLVILALILLLGNYTGYRLTELRRFRPLTESD